jgi:alpha-mannosidase
LEKAWRSLIPHALTPNTLFLNGNDHMEPWRDLSRLLDAARKELSDVSILHASLPMFISQLQDDLAERDIQLDVVQGELRNPKRHHMLPGVTSSRMWIKQRNAHAQMLLEKWIEPFAVFALNEHKEVGGDILSTLSLIHLAWKYLLQNHPHDSICGCGVDQTHSEMGLRFDWVEQIVEPLIAKTLSQLAAAVDTHAVDGVPVVVFNPASGPRTDHVLVQVELPVDWEGFTLKENSDAIVPFHIRRKQIKDYYHKCAPGELLDGLLGMVESGRIMGMAVQHVAIFAEEHPIRVDVTLSSQGEPHPALQQWQQQLRDLAVANPAVLFEIRGHSPACFEIEFSARDVPGYGYKTFTFAKAGQLASDSVIPDDAQILENEFYRLEPNPDDGTVTITDKATGQIYSRLNRFVDGGDRGDLYNYCPPENDLVVWQPATTPHIFYEKNQVRQSLHISMVYRLPASLTADRTFRSLETVDVNIETVVSLYPGVGRIDFQVHMENQARDHRLQVDFPTSITTPYVDAEQAFDVVRRPIDLPRDTKDWIEQPRPEAPFQNFVSISDDKAGLTLVTRGLPEYQAQQDDQGTTLSLTLLRCVGWLSRDDLATRSGHAGPALETPGAQEIGTHDFEYSLIPAASDWRTVIADAHAFVSTFQAIPTSSHYGTLPPAASFVDVTPDAFVISAIKPAEDGQGMIVRGYNISEKPINVALRFHRKPARVSQVNLIEEKQDALQISDDSAIRLGMNGKEIATLRIEF